MLKARRWDILNVGLLLAAAALLAALMMPYYPERSYVTGRFAWNLSHGGGFAYNPGQHILSDAAAPLYVIALALGASLTPDLLLLSNILGVVSLGAGAAVLYVLAHPAGRPAALTAAGVYLLSPLLWLTLGLETPFLMLLGLLALLFHTREKGLGTALMLGLATLCRPEIGAALGVVVIADSLLGGRSFQPLAAGLYVGLITLWVLWAVGHFESSGPLPGLTPAIPTAIGASFFSGLGTLIRDLLVQNGLWLGVFALATVGLLEAHRQRWAWAILGWAALHAVSLNIMGIETALEHYAPLVPALGTLAGLGVRWVEGRFPEGISRWIVRGASALIILAAAGWSFYVIEQSTGRDAAYRAAHGPALLPEIDRPQERAAGEWLRESTPGAALVGLTRAGAAAYYAQRPVLDYTGVAQPDLAEARARGDPTWWLAHYTPDYVVLSRAEVGSLDGYPLMADLWFVTSYQEVARFPDESDPASTLLVFRRVQDPLPMADAFAGMTLFPNGLTVNGIAIDFSLDPIQAGPVSRVRVQWLIDRPLTGIAGPQHVSIRVRHREEEAIIAQTDRVLDFTGWPHRRLITTYHTLEMSPALIGGIYDLEVGIGPDPFDLEWRAVAQGKVPFQADTSLGGVSGARAEFGDITLTGYRLARTEAGLEVLLLWQAVNAPQANYRVFIQVRALDGRIVVQETVEPHGGAYPTSFWSAGERVPDTYVLDVSGLEPGEYEVYAGLLAPDDRRLLAADGRDAVFVGRVNIGALGEE